LIGGRINMNVKTREFYVKVALISIIIITIASIFIERHVESINAEQEERRIEERALIMRLVNKAWFGEHMGFEFRIVEGDRIFTSGGLARAYIDPRQRFYSPFHTDIIFIHTKEEYINFTDDIILAWPRTIEDTGEVDTDFYEVLIDGIHLMVSRTELVLIQRGGASDGQPIRPVITLEEFGLSYPLTIEDLVDNWEKVSELWWALVDDERSRILQSARTGQRLR